MKFQEDEIIQLAMTLVYYTEDLKEDDEVSYQDFSDDLFRSFGVSLSSFIKIIEAIKNNYDIVKKREDDGQGDSSCFRAPKMD